MLSSGGSAFRSCRSASRDGRSTGRAGTRAMHTLKKLPQTAPNGRQPPPCMHRSATGEKLAGNPHPTAESMLRLRAALKRIWSTWARASRRWSATAAGLQARPATRGTVPAQKVAVLRGRAPPGGVRGRAEARRRRAFPRARSRFTVGPSGGTPQRRHDHDRRLGRSVRATTDFASRTIATAAARWSSTGASSPLRYAMGG